jgi:hypothetical protein
MRIDGSWIETETTVNRPFILAKIQTVAGAWIDCPLLIDTGADRTVLSAEILGQLGRATVAAPRQLGGVGGTVETVQVWAPLRFTTSDGSPITINGPYAAFTDHAALEESVLGWDVLGHFGLVIDKTNKLICLVRDRHRYVIQES